ncbi:capsule biosynthesis protein CapA [Halobacteriales archaeon QS_1_68_20]|nr:MAG: capsule biosynthesis protein CapA [Halobacteriales archaeon QS_1_68_20]
MTFSEDTLTLAAAGDAIVNRRVSAFGHERFRDVVDEVRAADASFVNLETVLHDYEGHPAAVPGGTYLRSPPWVADELAWMGFDLFGAATNHAGDYSHGGMQATMRELGERNLAYAGLGRNLAEAREPAYADTAAGRVALVAACSTVPPGVNAGRRRRDVQGRPGISPVRHEMRYVVPGETLEDLREVSEALGLEEVKRGYGAKGFDPDEEPFRFVHPDGITHLGFESGEEFQAKRLPHRRDVQEVLDGVRRASRQADWVVASLHAHEGAGASKNGHTVPKFVELFARECIDAGADAFVGHGPHVLRGIEVYEGTPIFYSLGNFFQQKQTVTRQPARMYQRYGVDPDDASPDDVYDERAFDDDGEPAGFLQDGARWESVLPVCEFDGDGLDRITLYPLDLMQEQPRPRRGRPIRATGAIAEEILDEIARLSEPYDTAISVEDGVGFVEP